MIVARSCESDLVATWSLCVPAQLGCEEHACIVERGKGGMWGLVDDQLAAVNLVGAVRHQIE